MRIIIVEYLKYSYKISQIGGELDTERTVTKDETLIIYDDRNQVCLCGAIDMTNKNIRLDILP